MNLKINITKYIMKINIMKNNLNNNISKNGWKQEIKNNQTIVLQVIKINHKNQNSSQIIYNKKKNKNNKNKLEKYQIK